MILIEVGDFSPLSVILFVSGIVTTKGDPMLAGFVVLQQAEARFKIKN